MGLRQPYPMPKQMARELLFMSDTTDKPQYACMSEVVMSKEELLKHLVENKAKHDVILAAAIAGYWDTAQVQLDTRKKKMDEQVDYYKAEVEREIARVGAKIAAKEELPAGLTIRQISIDTSLGLIYPQDHSKDYDRAIRMMQSSVFDQVRLSVDEYDAYVLNNWEWKANFLATNSFYVDTMRKKQNITGCWTGPQGPQGPQGRQGASGPAGSYAGYEVAANAACTSIQYSGCAAF